MQGVEPTAGLVHALGDEVGGEGESAIRALHAVAVLEGVMPLGVGHAAGIEPDVDQIGLAVHRTAVGRLEHDAIHHVLVQVDAGVVLIGHVPRHEVREGMGVHQAGFHRLSARGVQLLHRSDATLLSTVFGPPDGNRNAPVPRAAEVPIVEVLEPLSEASRAGGGGLPLDGVVELPHPVLGRGGPDEPAVQWVIQHRAVRPPAVWVAVLVLLDQESTAPGLQVNGNLHVHGLLRGVVVVVLLLDVASGERPAFRTEPSLQVHQRNPVALAVVHQQWRHASGLRDPGVVGTKRWRRVHDARAVLRGHEVAGNHAERLLRRVHRLGPINQLLVPQAHQIRALHRGEHLRFRGLLAPEMLAVQRSGEHHDAFLARVAVGRLDDVVVDLLSDGQGRVGRQRPWRGRPGQQVHRQVAGSAAGHGANAVRAVRQQAELGHHRGVGHVAVGAGLVELVAAESRAGLGAVGLNGVSLVEQALGVHLGEQPPHGLHVLRLVGDVRGLHVDPVSHAAGQVVPLRGVPHHGFATGRVVFLHGNGRANVFFGDAKGLLDPELHGQTVGVPTGFAFDPLALERAVTAEQILQGAGHHVVNAGLAIGRGRALEEDEAAALRAGVHTALEHVALLPLLHHLIGDGRQVQGASFWKTSGHGWRPAGQVHPAGRVARR